ncbi:hypothetical protein LJ753_16835 [Arthrobacter sp. zg-Y20]|uniref:phage tail tube protein n=1 Tax=unclassified Arthrobacter TaxID=235627 RepID=UPI001D152743|nr:MULTISPECIES: hypothetical protein [unclassified Arthrobacter]MCC3277532.1 hypothetical protein [Arthrobacter sp. zg-Y20]MDK1317690.1 hypothetical protein [Arthrobacter sp. zg.Y20]WIB07051.1 hypothetical protein QNO06_04805 [Arthrobacter sp. zg-Y20]
MALNSDNVRVAVTGAVYTLPIDVEGPDGASGTVVGGVDLGYVGDGGVTETRDRSSEKIKAWQHGATVREVVTEGSFTLSFVLLETKRENIELYYGGTVEADGSIVINPSSTGGRRQFVVDVIDDDDFIRTYIKSGQVTEVGDQVYANGEAIGYEVTVTAYDSNFDGRTGAAKKWYSSLAEAAA